MAGAGFLAVTGFGPWRPLQGIGGELRLQVAGDLVERQGRAAAAVDEGQHRLGGYRTQRHQVRVDRPGQTRAGGQLLSHVADGGGGEDIGH